jgi:glucose/arabinose dehydrogenase
MLTMLRRSASIIVLVGLVLLGLPPADTSAAGLALQVVGSGFDHPVFVAHAGDSRLFVVEQRGRIKIIHPTSSVTTFLNLSSLVSQTGSERGLLGLAFHPNYASNGFFYVNYTRASDGATVIAEYRRSGGNPDAADPTSARIVLTIAQPYSNHNGGWIAFKGPNLYIATGDGGSGGDPGNRAQSKKTLLGKILRINPLDPDGNGARRYSIPANNPYVGRRGKDEIWSRGLRNPWRCSFDRVTAKLWCADVGQGRYEEVNRSRTGKGVNYGWRLLEGRHLYPSGALCTTNCKTRPIAEYAHTAFGGGNCAVTGGYVSRRSGAALYGKYVFGDYCSGKVWVIGSKRKSGKVLPQPAADTSYLISSFGEGSDGRLYLVDLGGTVLRLSDS